MADEARPQGLDVMPFTRVTDDAVDIVAGLGTMAERMALQAAEIESVKIALSDIIRQMRRMQEFIDRTDATPDLVYVEHDLDLLTAVLGQICDGLFEMFGQAKLHYLDYLWDRL